MTLEERIVERRLHVITRATELGNVSQACREAGISRTLLYRWRKRFERYGADGLNPRLTRAKLGRPVETPPHVERLVIAWSLSWPTWGCGRIAAQLGFLELAEISPSTVQRILRRAGLPTRRERLAVLEAHTAQGAGLLTERSRRALQRARAKKRHVEASTPGELVCLDTFYIGRLKGVGKVWQITACDAASSFGTARILPALDAKFTAWFLTEVLVPLYRQAGHPIQRVLVDGGSEFKSHFRLACKRLGIRRTKQRSRATPGPTGSSSGCRVPSSTSTGGSPSGDATSPAGASSPGASRRSSTSTTTSDPIRDIAPEAEPPPKRSTDSARPQREEDQSANTITELDTLEVRPGADRGERHEERDSRGG